LKRQDQENYVEIQFIRNILGSFIKGDPEKIKADEKVNWKWINNYAINQNLVSIFLHTLNTETVPAEIMENWRQLKMRILFTQIKALRATCKLFSILEDAKIQALCMRGIILSNTIYQSIDMRPMRDVDLLIRPGDVLKFVNALKGNGIEPYRRCRTQYQYQIDDIKYEVHWSLLTAKRYRLKLDTDKMLESRKKIETQEGTLYSLSDENEFLGLVLHAFIHHDLYVMLSLIDIGLFMSRSGNVYDYMAVWGRKSRLTRIMHFSLAYINYLFKLEQEDRLKIFMHKLPCNIEMTYQAYKSNLFDNSSIFTYLRRNRNLLYVAEEPSVKFKQFLRFFSLSEFYELQNHLRWRSAGV